MTLQSGPDPSRPIQPGIASELLELVDAFFSDISYATRGTPLSCHDGADLTPIPPSKKTAFETYGNQTHGIGEGNMDLPPDVTWNNLRQAGLIDLRNGLLRVDLLKQVAGPMIGSLTREQLKILEEELDGYEANYAIGPYYYGQENRNSYHRLASHGIFFGYGDTLLMDNYAVLIVGNSCSGKSTLAQNLSHISTACSVMSHDSLGVILQQGEIVAFHSNREDYPIPPLTFPVKVVLFLLEEDEPGITSIVPGGLIPALEMMSGCDESLDRYYPEDAAIREEYVKALKLSFEPLHCFIVPRYDSSETRAKHVLKILEETI